jgi:hypothetical protein
LLACGGGGGGGGGFFTDAEVDVAVFKPRESVQVALTVMVPGDAPVVLRVAELPLPEMLPPLALHPATVTGTPSGLVQVQVTVTGVPASTDDGLAEQEISGGFIGLTMNLDEQLAVLLFFSFGSVTVAVAV